MTAPERPRAAGGTGAAGVVPFAQASRDLLRATLLDAMRAELRTRAWGDVTMADVARAAGVSRQTLYKELGSRQELAQAYVLREADRFLVAVREAVERHLDDPTTALAAAFEVFLTAAAEDPVVRAVVSGDGGDELLPLLTTQGRPVLQHATDNLAAFLQEGWPALGEQQAQLLAESVVRLAISYAALPSGPSAMTGRSVADLLGPYVERALATEG